MLADRTTETERWDRMAREWFAEARRAQTAEEAENRQWRKRLKPIADTSGPEAWPAENCDSDGDSGCD